MRKNLLLLLALLAMLASCKPNVDDFAFEGTAIDFEMCTGTQDVGYAIQITSPDSLLGGTYLASDGKQYQNVVVLFCADRIIRNGAQVEGRMFFDNNYSSAYCNYHYRSSRGDVPEGRFSKINKVVSDDKHSNR